MQIAELLGFAELPGFALLLGFALPLGLVEVLGLSLAELLFAGACSAMEQSSEGTKTDWIDRPPTFVVRGGARALEDLAKPPGFLLAPGVVGGAAYDSSRRAARTIQKKESFMPWYHLQSNRDSRETSAEFKFERLETMEVNDETQLKTRERAISKGTRDHAGECTIHLSKPGAKQGKSTTVWVQKAIREGPATKELCLVLLGEKECKKEEHRLTGGLEDENTVKRQKVISELCGFWLRLDAANQRLRVPARPRPTAHRRRAAARAASVASSELPAQSRTSPSAGTSGPRSHANAVPPAAPATSPSAHLPASGTQRYELSGACCTARASCAWRTPRKACPARACRAVMLVLVSRTELDDGEARAIRQSSVRFANYGAVCVRNAGQVLVKWVAKMEGRESLLEHAAQVRR
ncbi:hypothetical protein C8J57DRAFT_1647323 [Mycena rebaudengoi]|nr:hypothetical protein C8J57DRAFT_1647323 [Mycena rebaudengoi]